MGSLFVVPGNGQTSYEAEVSPTFALVSLLPLVNLAPSFPGLAPWVYELPRRLSAHTKQEFALVTALTYRLMPRLTYGDEEMAGVEALLSYLSRMDAAELRAETVLGLSEDGASGSPPADPATLRALVATLPASTPGETVTLDVDMAVDLLQRPEALKAFLTDHLRHLWLDHLKPHWERGLDAVHHHAAAARTQFGSGSPAAVFQGVTGRPLPDSLVPAFTGMVRVLFCPLPFFGPYVTVTRRPDIGDIRIGYGVAAQIPPGAAPAGGHLPGGLLPALEALADETRLAMLSYLRDRGSGRAQDFMDLMGLSQPATSRHLRLLESTGLVHVERRDGVKWYHINAERLSQIAQGIKSLSP